MIWSKRCKNLLKKYRYLKVTNTYYNNCLQIVFSFPSFNDLLSILKFSEFKTNIFEPKTEQ